MSFSQIVIANTTLRLDIGHIKIWKLLANNPQVLQDISHLEIVSERVESPLFSSSIQALLNTQAVSPITDILPDDVPENLAADYLRPIIACVSQMQALSFFQSVFNPSTYRYRHHQTFAGLFHTVSLARLLGIWISNIDDRQHATFPVMLSCNSVCNIRCTYSGHSLTGNVT